MRFIIPELPYEEPLAKGLWRYEQNGRPTGATETWRLSEAQNGFYFLRVDLDARAARSGRSLLFHAVINENRQVIRVKYRLWQGSSEVIGNIHLEQDSALFTSGINQNRKEAAIAMPSGFLFWFPASTSLGLLATNPAGSDIAAITIHLVESGDENMLLEPLITELTIDTEREKLDGGRVVRLAWQGQERMIWLDSQDQALRMERQDGLSAVEKQLVTYRRITVPGGASAKASPGSKGR